MFDLYLRLWYKAISTSQFKKPRTQNSLFPGQKGKCEMNTNPRSSITRPVPRSPSLTFRISKRSARTIVSKLNPHSLPFLIFSEAYTFPRRVKSRVWPGDWRRALLFLPPDWWLVKKKSRKFLARTRPLCAVKRHYSLLQIKEYF